MKRLVLTSTLIIFFAFSSFSQGMEPGMGYFSIGFGPGSSYIYRAASLSPAFRMTFDHGFKEIGPGTLTIGGMLGTSFGSNRSAYINYVHKYSWVNITAAFRVAYYYNLSEFEIENLNVYGGFSSGPRYYIFTNTYEGTYTGNQSDFPNTFKFHFGSFLGANYFITPRTAVFTEFGYDISWFTLGVTLKM